MKSISHNLKFVTELDESHPVAIRLLALPESEVVAILEDLLYSEIAPRFQSILDEMNEGNSYALLKIAEVE